MPELRDNYNIYLYTGGNPYDDTDTKDYIPFTNDYSNVMQFDSVESRDKYFDTIPRYEIYRTEENRVFMDGGVIKISFGSSLHVENGDFSNIKYMRIDTLWGDEEVAPGVLPANYKLSNKYYFVNSYEIISSYRGITVVAFNIEYDYWMNNQFDFNFRESNIERMHVDRWAVDSGNIAYTRPMLDALESNMQINKNIDIEPESQVSAIYGNSQSPHLTSVLWVMVTASHSFNDSPDQLLYHFFPIIYKDNQLVFDEADPEEEEFYTQNSILCVQSNVKNFVFPSLQCLDNTYLAAACGNGSNHDAVEVINVQIFNWLPLKLVYGEIEGEDVSGYIVTDMNLKHLKFYGGTVNFVSSKWLCSFATGDLSFMITDSSSLTNSFYTMDFSKPTKPIDNDNYSPSHEPALYLSPVIKRYIVMGDLSAQAEIPDILFINTVLNGGHPGRLVLNERVSFSATSAYCYFWLGEDRASSNMQGFAIIKPSYLFDILTNPWKEYCVTQRDSDRMMMWTNIATGGIAEAGSTAVSAGIGYRQNMERAQTTMHESKFAKSQENYYRRTAKNGDMAQFYDKLQRHELNPNVDTYKGMAGSAMMMSGVGGVAAFSANAIHQGMAQRAKEKAIINTPGSLAKAGNSIGTIIDNQLKLKYVETIADYTTYSKYSIVFMKYGYYIGTVELPDINSRKYFNYIKTNGAILTGKANNLILSALASIFDNGVTIWHMDYCVEYTTQGETEVVDELRMYDYTKENIERSLI